MQPRICESRDCRKEFDPISPRQTFCSHTCGTRERQRRHRAKHRKGGPGGNGGGNGGGSSPSLFDSIVPVSSDAFVPVPVIGPNESEQRRKPAHRVHARSNSRKLRKPPSRAALKARKSPKAAA